MEFQIVQYDELYHEWARQVLMEEFGSDLVVVHNQRYYPANFQGFVALVGNQPEGLATYLIQEKECELVSLNSLLPNQGIGAALVAAVKQVAQNARCTRLWLITTNDNLDALRFYQKNGFVLKAIYPQAVTHAREIKPSIPLIGNFGIEMRDEIELEQFLNPV
jgi:GNAT superfamily N-acetyltransferase